MNNLPKTFLSLDWGTSFFRLRLVQAGTLSLVAEETSNQGVANVFKQWQGTTQDRLSFYTTAAEHHLSLLAQKTDVSLPHLPLIVSGMASSAIGMMEVPYTELPFSLDGSDITVQKIVASSHFQHDIYLIGGAKTDDDAMRGEETQVVGCADETNVEEQVIVLPGTHSKHVVVKGGKAVDFRTYMTGEFFDLLSQKSILSVSVEKGEGLQREDVRQHFEKGVREGVQANLLHACFRVRTDDLFGKAGKRQGYHYLSGLLIGAELQDLLQTEAHSIKVVGNDLLSPLYAEALRLLLPNKKIETKKADEAVVKGQFRIYAKCKEA